MATKNELEALEAEYNRVQRLHLQAEAARDTAKANLAKALGALKEEFGVSSMQEAIDLKNTLTAEFEEKVAEAKRLLEEAS